MAIEDKKLALKKTFLFYVHPLKSIINSLDKKKGWIEQMTFLIQDFKTLLNLPFKKFWSTIVYNKEATNGLSSFLKYGGPLQLKDLLPLENDILDIYNKINNFAYLLIKRLTTSSENKKNYMSPKHKWGLLYNNNIITITILFDICSMYGKTYKTELEIIFKELFSCRKLYNGDLKMFVSSTIQILNEYESKLQLMLACDNRLHECNRTSVENEETNIIMIEYFINFLFNNFFSILNFLEVYPIASSIYYNEKLHFVIASLYHNVNPIIYKTLITMNKLKQFEEKINSSKLLLMKSAQQCLSHLTKKMIDTKGSHDLVEEYVEVVIELLQYNAFLSDYDGLYNLTNDIKICQKIYKNIDAAKYDNIIKSLKLINTQKNEHNILQRKQLEQLVNSSNLKSEKLHVLIRYVKDLLPYLGDGFIQKCLEYYDLDHEKVINMVLEDCLPPELTQYNFNLSTISEYDMDYNKDNITGFDTATKESIPSQKIPGHGITNHIDKFSKIVYPQNKIYNQKKSKAVTNWNKKHLFHTSLKTNKSNSSIENNFNFNTNHGRTSGFSSVAEIPTIENNSQSRKVKPSNAAEFIPAVFEVLTYKSPPKSTSMHNIPEIEHTKYNSIEVITNINNIWYPPPTADELQNRFTLESILKTVPPCLSNSNMSNQCDNTIEYLNLYNSMNLMGPENVMYEALHPSIEEQSLYCSMEHKLNSSTITAIDILETSSKEIDSNKNSILIQPANTEGTQKFEQCHNNIEKHIDSGVIDISKLAREKFVDRSPVIITDSFFKNKPIVSNFGHFKIFLNTIFFKNLKLITNYYQNQPSNLFKITNFESKRIASKSDNDMFRITEEDKTEKTDATSIAFEFHNEQLSTAPQTLKKKKILKKPKVELNTENKFAIKIFNGLKKKYLIKQEQFLSDTVDPMKKIELHNKLVPTVRNALCARLIKKGNEDSRNKISMKFDELTMLCPILTLKDVFKKNFTSPKNNIMIKDQKSIKRKLPLKTSDKIKRRKTFDLPISKTKNQLTVTNKTNDDVILKKPMMPMVMKKSIYINSTANSKRREHVFSRPMTLLMAVLVKNAIVIEPEPGNSSKAMASKTLLRLLENKVIQVPNSSNQTSPIIGWLKNLKEIRLKQNMTEMKGFNKVDNISTTKLEKNARNLAKHLNLNYSTNELPINPIGNELIKPILHDFNSSINLKKTMNSINCLDNPIMRDYMQQKKTLKTLEPQRIYKLPKCLMSLPVKVLNLIPNNKRDFKYIVDYYYAMTALIVRVLNPYTKKTCYQGRIKNNEDFKYLVQKFNSNILFEELQVKKVEDLKLCDTVIQNVEQYIRKYMLQYGKEYRRKITAKLN